MKVFRSVEEFEALLARADKVLTPHLRGLGAWHAWCDMSPKNKPSWEEWASPEQQGDYASACKLAEDYCFHATGFTNYRQRGPRLELIIQSARADMELLRRFGPEGVPHNTDVSYHQLSDLLRIAVKFQNSTHKTHEN